jgi:AP endonuclease-2
MKIMARETNYGTRVDYILVTPGLLPWIKHGDIQPSLKGSDHCPIYIDLHETIVDSEGRTRTLKEEIGNVNPERREPARLASRNWDEYSGKQKLLSSFFGKGKSKAPEVDIGSPVSTSAATILASTTSTSSNNTNVSTNEAVSSATQLPSSNMKDHSALQGDTARKSTLPSAPPITLSIIPISAPAPSSPTGQTPLKRKSSHSSMAANPAASDAYDAVVPKKLKSKAAKDTPVKDKDTSASKSKASQQSISSFFGKPKGIKSSAGPATVIDVDDDDTPETVADADLDADYQLALKLSQEHDIGSLPPSQGTLSSAKATDPAETKMAWSNVFAKVEPPRCTTHNEPAKSFTVNKGGPNKGRAFFVCARYVHPMLNLGKMYQLLNNPRQACWSRV